MKTIFILASFILSNFFVNAQGINKEKLDSLFTILENKNQTMGTIHISKDGEPIYSRSIGYSSLEEQVKADEKTRYRIGSITKIFTATLIFQLIDEGKISMSTPLMEYFTEIPNADKITIGSLLNHSSGIFNITSSEDFNPYEAKTHEEIISSIAGFKPVFEPDTKSEYSNSNYILLGYIIEKTDKSTYANALTNRITNKLALQNTYYGGPVAKENNEAYSYLFDDTWVKSEETDMRLPHGAGAIVSTPQDLTVFINALFNNELISEKSLAEMTRQKNGLGFGIMSMNVDNLTLYGHDGGIDGFSSLLIYVPEGRLAIAFTSNGNQYSDIVIVKSALMACYNMPFELPSFEKIELTTADLQKYSGVYTCPDAPMSLTFTHKEGQLMGAPSGQTPTLLKATKKHQFKLEQAGITLDFNPEDKSLYFTQSGNKLLFKKN